MWDFLDSTIHSEMKMRDNWLNYEKKKYLWDSKMLVNERGSPPGWLRKMLKNVPCPKQCYNEE